MVGLWVGGRLTCSKYKAARPTPAPSGMNLAAGLAVNSRADGEGRDELSSGETIDINRRETPN